MDPYWTATKTEPVQLEVKRTDAVPNLKAQYQNKMAKKGNRTKPNYFKKQIQRFGDAWLEKKTIEDLERDVEAVMRDFVKGNMAYADINFFYEPKFSQAMRNACYNKLREYSFRSMEAKIYRETMALQQIAIDQYCDDILRTDDIKANAYADYQNALTVFAQLSINHDEAVRYMIDNFQVEIVRKYRPYSRCF